MRLRELVRLAKELRWVELNLMALQFYFTTQGGIRGAERPDLADRSYAEF